MKADYRQLLRATGTFATLLVTLAGCSVGPDYKKPEVTVPTEFRSQVSATEASSFADLPWWSVFQDEALQGLITEALKNNYDIQVAAARIEQARALVGIVGSQYSPQLGYRVFGGHEETFVPTVDGAGAGTAGFNSVGAVLEATWEFDLWGRIRRSTEAAEANLYAQEEVRSGVLMTLVSDIAAGYFRLLEFDREFAIAQDSARVYKKTLDLFTARFEAGRDNKLPVHRAQAAYDSSTAKMQDLRRAITQQENALSVLVGGYPRPIQRGGTLASQAMPATPLGSTTDLLQRRPDIRATEQNMIRANAEIGVAVANYFPTIGIGALLGGLGVDISDDFETFSVGNIALAATGPIFTGGRLNEVYKSRQAFWDETVAQYKKQIAIAFQETSDALIAQQTLVTRRTALESQVAALQASSDIALTRYDAGRANYFEVLEAQERLFPAQDSLAQAQRDQLLAVVSLYKALGGGWRPVSAEQGAPASGGK